MEPNDRAYHRQMYIDLIRAYLRELRVLRAMAAYEQASGDLAALDEVLRQALALSAAAGLLHQCPEIMRLYRSRSSPLCRSR